ncbi:hypothetical protein, partial [Pseudomonas savastanoi]|uniref:hypothetical protein n=1 Tax=Pseudomonas savastanoi TaxID=29438 RepID=UPI001CC1C281
SLHGRLKRADQFRRIEINCSANDFSIGMEFKESENELAPVSEIDQNNHGSLVDLSIMNVQRSGDQSGD